MKTVKTEDRSIYIAIALLVVLLPVIGFTVKHDMDNDRIKSKGHSKVTANEMFELVNYERTKRGIKPLTREVRLDESARLKAGDMLEFGYYDHGNSMTSKQGYEYIFQMMPECKYASENLVDKADETSSADNVSAWMGSDSHRKAILDTRYEIAGISIINDKSVMHFCDLG